MKTPPRVLSISPAGAVWPENMLRLHLVFDRAMDMEGAPRHVRLCDEAGDDIEAPFVDLPDGLWNAEQTILTLLFHPGRVKTGLRAREALGPLLVEGRRYRLRVDASMRDADGVHLSAPFTHEIEVGPRLVTPLDPARWQLPPPSPHSHDPLVMTIDRPLDMLALRGGIGLVDHAGEGIAVTIHPGNDGHTLVVQPEAPWPEGAIALRVSPLLEDVAGNRVTNPFERALPRERGPQPLTGTAP